jgi:hypothetical protein
MVLQFRPTDPEARELGLRTKLDVCSGGRCEIDQFWQNLHLELQPLAAIEKALVPGKKWNRGFFSIGSICKAQRRE